MSNILSYQSWGDSDRPPLLMLHGFMGCGADWESVARALEGDFHCIAPDLPGHGRSPFDRGMHRSFEHYARSVMALLDALDLESVAALGYSMGGRVLLALALAEPNRFSRLILESASPGIADPAERQARQLADQKLAQRMMEQDQRSFLMEWYSQPLFGALKGSARFPALLQRRLANNPVRLAAVLDVATVGKQRPLWAKLSELDQSLLLVYGAEDTKYRDLAVHMVERNSRITARSIEACSHAAHVEQPERFSEICRAYLCSRK
ncbi:MAG: 2-succinyl-6-hydroxy-2,4-cyclohexadiene-1-carboxylate synthase [Lentisphaerae bacterium]|nr:2-succinyl-6-hydroxy-2,4-cyclohexadiene-1-carboxylate synthase [Lentisphaerota bacterium]